MGANAKVVEQAYSAFGKGDIPALMALIADDVTWTSPRTLPQGGDYKGKAEVVTFFENIGAAWDGLTLEAESVGEVGDRSRGRRRAARREAPQRASRRATGRRTCSPCGTARSRAFASTPTSTRRSGDHPNV